MSVKLRNEYKELIEQYRDANSKKKEFDKIEKAAKDDLDRLLHEDSLDNIEVELSDGKVWKVDYRTRNGKTINYDTMERLLTEAEYNQVVLPNQSTYLSVGEKKTPKTRKTVSKPTTTTSVEIPKGKLNNTIELA